MLNSAAQSNGPRGAAFALKPSHAPGNGDNPRKIPVQGAIEKHREAAPGAMPLRSTPWQRRATSATEPVIVEPTVPAEPAGLRRLLAAEPAGSTVQLLVGLVALILLVHVGGIAFGVHVAWLWAGVAVVAGAAFLTDWPEARRLPPDDPVTRRAALTGRLLVFAGLGVAFSLAAL